MQVREGEDEAGLSDEEEEDGEQKEEVALSANDILVSIKKAMHEAFSDVFPQVRAAIEQAVKAALAEELLGGKQEGSSRPGTVARRQHRIHSNGITKSSSFQARRQSEDTTSAQSAPRTGTDGGKARADKPKSAEKETDSEKRNQHEMKVAPILNAIKAKNKLLQGGRRWSDAGQLPADPFDVAPAEPRQRRRSSAGAGEELAPKKIPTFLRLDVEADLEEPSFREFRQTLPVPKGSTPHQRGLTPPEEDCDALSSNPSLVPADSEARQSDAAVDPLANSPSFPHTDNGQSQGDAAECDEGDPRADDKPAGSSNDQACIAVEKRSEPSSIPKSPDSPSSRPRNRSVDFSPNVSSISAEDNRSAFSGVVQAMRGILNRGSGPRANSTSASVQRSRSSSLMSSGARRLPYESAEGRTPDDQNSASRHRSRSREMSESPGSPRCENARASSKGRTKSKSSAESTQTPPWGHQNRRKAVILDSAAVAQLKRKDFSRNWQWPFTDPHGLPRRCWDIVGFVMLFFQLLYVPFNGAFVSIADLQDPFFNTINKTLAVVDCFWLVDIALNFTTGFTDARHTLQTNWKLIASRYAKGWLVFDCIATVPSLLGHLLFYTQLATHIDTYVWLSLAPIVRVPRLVHVARQVRQLELYLKSTVASSIIAIVQLMMLPISFSHITACALWAIGRYNLSSDTGSPSWIKGGLSVPYDPGALQAVSMYDRYTTAMYFAVTVMTTVGLGDISTEMSNERCLLMVIMLCTSLVVGVAVNGVAMLVSKLGERSSQTNQNLARAANFMRSYSVPPELQHKVNAYLLQYFETKDRDETKSLLLGWMKKSEHLRVSLNLALTGNCLAEHDLLGHIPLDVLVNLCDVCAMVFYSPGEELESAGQDVKTCFYIRHGTVTLSDVVRKSKKAHKGNTNTKYSITAGTELLAGPSEIVDASQTNPFQSEIDEVERRRISGNLTGGSFISDFRLFLGVSKATRTVTCATFCELISFDIEDFQRLMRQSMPELLDTLTVYSAINNDCPSAMVGSLEEMEYDADDILLFGETPLHHCALKNSCKCATYLVDELNADLSIPTQDGKMAAQLAADLKHKAVFELLIMNGAVVCDEDVLPSEAYTVRGRREGHNRVRSASSRDLSLGVIPARNNVKIPSVTSGGHLREMLESAGLKIGDTGENGQKAVDDLLHELRTCDSVLTVRPGKRLRRIVKIVRVRVMAIIEEQVRGLVELQTDAWARNPQQKLGKLPCRRMLHNQAENDALEELLVDIGFTREILEEDMVSIVGKAVFSEITASMSYPGLETEYIVHETTLRVKKQGMYFCLDVGLPQGTAFKAESTVAPLQTISRVFFWPVLLHIQVEQEGGGLNIHDEAALSPKHDRSANRTPTLSKLNPFRNFLSPSASAVVHPAPNDLVIIAKQSSIKDASPDS